MARGLEGGWAGGFPEVSGPVLAGRPPAPVLVMLLVLLLALRSGPLLAAGAGRRDFAAGDDLDNGLFLDAATFPGRLPGFADGDFEPAVLGSGVILEL